MQNHLLISVITPTLDDGASLARTVGSIDSQNYRPIEHIIVDGGTDASETVSESAGLTRRHVAALPLGVYDAVNQGLNICNGDIIGVLNGNDRLASRDVLIRVAAAFASDPTLDYVYGPAYFSDAKGRVVRRYHIDGFSINDLRHGFAPPHPSLYIRRRAAKRCGLYDCSYTTAADFDMFVRLMNDSALQGRPLDFYFADMSTGGRSGRWHNRLLTNPRERLRSLRSHGFKVGLLSLLPRYFRLFKEYFR